MFCTNCGSRNSDEAIYCQKCGRLLEAEEETRVVSHRKPATAIVNHDSDEKQIFSISPTLKFIGIGYVAAIFGAFLLVALMSILYDYLMISPWIAVLLGLSLLLIPAFYHLKQKIVRYTLTDAKIEIDTGLISRTTRNVPLHTIQDVTVSATVMQRMLGFGDLIIENANENDGKVILKNINSPKKYADILLKQMRLLK
ncbi:MAG: hypothetical protein JWN60_2920 [Acidobacteria bacterium]|jgi:uncharacterized membrane protein YdbT with pleckstrin-like domain|nr:hypothetical protein [Acidobacteriota bacterium]